MRMVLLGKVIYINRQHGQLVRIKPAANMGGRCTTTVFHLVGIPANQTKYVNVAVGEDTQSRVMLVMQLQPPNKKPSLSSGNTVTFW
jgi:hypothetical protein